MLQPLDDTQVLKERPRLSPGAYNAVVVHSIAYTVRTLGHCRCTRVLLSLHVSILQFDLPVMLHHPIIADLALGSPFPM
jgi:hypothetical protein